MGSYVCTRYEVLSDGERINEVWVAPSGPGLLKEAELQTFRAMAEFFEPLSKGTRQSGWGLSGMEQMKGFPVRRLDYEGERVVSEWETTKVERRALESSLFTVPPGLKKQKMPTGRPR